ncbi:MAG TPA: hypothetical protein VGH30_08105 [Jatrophihabitantaceae bacterium]|jgi:hypothetical protein
MTTVRTDLSTVRSWFRAPDHSLGIVLLLLGLFLASSAVAMMFTG